ncbi:site-specific integrase [Acidovorax sp. Root219]|uniref:site-specific integrase n=1 Tax=Acidovorax sp. Root219 TaxID=1736493 RepID=UPI00070C2FFE|nr:site-specific integrase [Acidovorax sp. Root219]KRC28752.1 integrase [Acidovorax sp. Root219]
MAKAAIPPQSNQFPSAAELAALRGWYAGMTSRACVMQYLQIEDATRQSSRRVLGDIRRQLSRYALARHRQDLAALLEHDASERDARARSVLDAIETIRRLPEPMPFITDELGRWLPARAVTAMNAYGLKTLADLTVRVPRRRQWWKAVPGLGAMSARQVEAFFASHPELTEKARSLLAAAPRHEVVPWEQIRLPAELDGSRGRFRAPADTSTLDARNDYEAVHAWLSLHESTATQRAYRKEAERLLLWAVLEREKALSSLSSEDAVAYRAFLRRPTPRARWVGPARPRSSADWRPFAGGLSARSVAHSVAVINALFRWLMQQRYSLANPFAGIKVRGASRSESTAAQRYFSPGEWSLLQTIAEGLEWREGWSPAAAQRLRFVLNFTFATGLRVSELVGARLAQIEIDGHGDRWLHVLGKGAKKAKVAMPSLARSSLDQYLMHRRLPTTPSRWRPETPLVGQIGGDEGGGITAARLWTILRRFFNLCADVLEAENPSMAEKLRRASTHWVRHSHATHALANGVDLIAVRDNLRHASVQTTSVYLHVDQVTRAKQIETAFQFPSSAPLDA